MSRERVGLREREGERGAFQASGEHERWRGRSGTASSNRLVNWNRFTDTFFFCNFPDSCEIKDMWRMFERFGVVVDVYISRKKTVRGSRFGFVRFKKGGNPRYLESKLKDVWFGSYKLRINLSRFSNASSGSGSSFNKKEIAGHAAPLNSQITAGRSFKEAFSKPFSKEPKGHELLAIPKKSGRPVVDAPDRKCVTVNQSRDEGVSGSGNLNLTDTVENKEEPIILECSEEDWLSTCLVGELKNDSLINSIENLMLLENFSFSAIKSLGGRRVLVECECLEHREKLLNSIDWFNQWFDWIKTCNKGLALSGRRATLLCYGVPLHA